MDFLAARKSRISITGYEDIGDLIYQTAEVFRPPDRMNVAEWAARDRKLNNSGAYVGDWKHETAPYLVEPMRMLGSREHDAVILAAPAQCGKTEIILNWIGHSVIVDPGDLTVFNPTQANARDFSTRRLDRMMKATEVVGKEILGERDADNKFDKTFKSGMIVGLAWPTVAELAGKPIGRIAITDRDRMDDDIDGEGDPFDLATKRTTSFGSFAMTYCESSPSRDIVDPRYILKSPHEAPPTKGILALYNRGTRNRWYWPCGRCNEFFEGRFESLRCSEPETADILTRAESVYMLCPRCDHRILPDARFGMQQEALWVPDLCSIDRGRIVGTPRRSRIASYWLEGCAAAFTTWTKLMSTYLTAEEEFESSMNEEPLRKFYNTDLGRLYRPKAMESERQPEDLKNRAEPIGKNEKGEVEIISNVRFLVACVDVQQNMWIVQVFGIMPGNPFDILVVDRFDIRKSLRKDADGDTLWVKPGTYIDDWALLEEQVIRRTYPIADSDKRMAIKLVACDSGGKAGVTAMAYKYWLSLKNKGLGTRFALVKGTGSIPTAPHVKETWPDSSNRKDRNAGGIGNVPVWQFNSNLLKNEANNRLDSIVPGRGMIRMPNWLPDWFFGELCAEVSKDKGWEKIPGKRNEAWDLLYYLLGICKTKFIRADVINWNDPPVWASDNADTNPLILDAGVAEPFAARPKSRYNLADIAKSIA